MNAHQKPQTSNSASLLIALSVMFFLINVDYTAMNLTLPTLVNAFDTNLSTVQWVLSGYVLAWAVVIVPAGKLTDFYGAKRLCLVGLSLFAVASLISGLANTASLVIWGRVLQGIAGALFTPGIYACIFQNFPEERRGFAMGMVSLGVGAGAAFGPSFGGVLLTWFGWRSVFFVNLPICLFCFSIIYSQAKTVATDANASEKLSYFKLFHIPRNLFKNKAFLGCAIPMGMEQIAFATIFVVSGIYMQYHLHYSAWTASMMYLPMTCLFGVIAAMSGKFIDKIGVRSPAIYGLLLMVVGIYGYGLVESFEGIPYFQTTLIIAGIGMGFAFAALNTAVVKVVEAHQVGIASSVFILFALLGNSIGVMSAVKQYDVLHYSVNSIMTLCAIIIGLSAFVCWLFLPRQTVAESVV